MLSLTFDAKDFLMQKMLFTVCLYKSCNRNISSTHSSQLSANSA